MSAPARGRFPWLTYAIALVAIVFLAVLPLLSVLITSLIADANGCRVNEAVVQPCIVMGTDLGGLLSALGIMGWLMLATIPLGGLAAAAWLIVLILHYRRWRGGPPFGERDHD